MTSRGGVDRQPATSGRAIKVGVRVFIPLTLATLVLVGFRAIPHERTIGAFATSLQARTGSQRHNARLSMERLNGAVIPPHEVFSFNQVVGSFSRDQGFRRAPVSYNGQLIDDWGGGVCQTSTTLYNAALLAGMQIVERNRHQFQPSYVSPGRDAAVAFSNIDLRFQNPYDFPVKVEAKIVSGMLRVELLAAQDIPERPIVYSQILDKHNPSTFNISRERGGQRLRNSGKRGWEVAVFRMTGNKKEMISKDSYPVMHRVVEVGP